jgi:hypothetical protein
MNLFQALAGTCLILLIIGELVRWRSGVGGRGIVVLRVAVWLAAICAIADPGLLQRFAELLGIGRGADVLLYLAVLAFLGASFYLYSRTVILQRQVTELARRFAIDRVEKREIE